MCQQVDEEFLGGVGYTDFFFACVFSLKAEELIKRSPRGRRVHLLLEKITNIEAVKVTDIAMLLISKACSCIASGDKPKLPSTAQACVWSTFHQLRGSSEVKGAWDKFVSTHLLESSQEEHFFTTKQTPENKRVQLIVPPPSSLSLPWKVMPSGICLVMLQ